MAKVYYELILKGKKTIDDVPARYRAAVEALIEAAAAEAESESDSASDED